jgi:hypothetical protein
MGSTNAGLVAHAFIVLPTSVQTPENRESKGRVLVEDEDDAASVLGSAKANSFMEARHPLGGAPIHRRPEQSKTDM